MTGCKDSGSLTQYRNQEFLSQIATVLPFKSAVLRGVSGYTPAPGLADNLT